MQACQGGHKRIVKLLIKSKAEINTQDKKGNTALHYASTYGFQAVVDYLLGKEADVSITNAQGKSCLEGI
jgi:ankyrin repeat protein